MNPCLDRSPAQNAALCPRKRLLGNVELFLLYLEILGGSNTGSIGITKNAFDHGVSNGTISNYFTHTAYAVHEALEAHAQFSITWPDAEERELMHDLVVGFPRCGGFVDGSNIGRPRPEDEEMQEAVYCGHHKTHCWATMIWNDIWGIYIKVDVAYLGSTHDQKLFEQTLPYSAPDLHFSQDEHLLSDTGFIGDGDVCVFPFENGQGLDFALRGDHSQKIRTNRMTNEWSVVYNSNRHRIFLGKWTLSPERFPICFVSAARMAKFAFR